MEDAGGGVQRLELRAGAHLAERAYDRSDVTPQVRHARPEVLSSIAQKRILDDELKASLKAALEEFGKQFAARAAA